MSKTSSPESGVTFNSPDDFHLWEQDFGAVARSKNLWKHLMPGPEREPWPVLPPPLKIGAFPLRSNVQDWERATFLELTDAGRVQYGQFEQHYEGLRRKHRELQKDVSEVSQWMRKTVSPEYRLTHLPMDQTIDQWYDNLRTLGEITQRAQKFQYKNEYEAFITKSSGKRIPNLAKWSDEWLQRITKAHNAGAEVTEPFKLVTDLDRALRSSHPSWATAFRTNHSMAIANNTLDYRTIATELRQEAAVLNVNKSSSSNRVVRGGAFNTLQPPGSGGESDYRASDTEDEAPKGGRQRKPRGRADSSKKKGASNQGKGSPKPQRGASKRPRAETRTEAEQENPNHTDCIVCYGRHSIDRCWYVFPELRNTSWKLNEQIEKLAHTRMAEIREVMAAVKAARERRKGKRVRFDGNAEDNNEK
ncbi:hypothetical protein F4861DRAFT_543729 [Xylaria intraflava]|nr:hypothetical protein F4861DRAFT_543729 [Xylaria intraflava]